MSHFTANSDLAKARRAARWLRLALNVALVLGVIVVGALWFVGTGAHALGHVTFSIQMPPALRGYPRLAQITVSAVLLVSLYGLWRLRKLMRCFEAGDFFGLAPTLHLRAFALALLVAVGLDVLLPPLLLVAAHLLAPHGAAVLRLQLDGGDVWSVLVAGLFFVIAWLLAEARRASEDSAQIV